MVQGKINRGRHTDHPAGRHSIRINPCPPPQFPHFLQGGFPSCHQTNNIKALKATSALPVTFKIFQLVKRWTDRWNFCISIVLCTDKNCYKITTNPTQKRSQIASSFTLPFSFPSLPFPIPFPLLHPFLLIHR